MLMFGSAQSADADGVACVDQVGVLDVGVQGHQVCNGGVELGSDGAEGIAGLDGVVVGGVTSTAGDVIQFHIDHVLVFHSI